MSILYLPQESISDFYWYYSGKDIIDEPGKRNFSKAMTVAKQVFNSLTEYIQVRNLTGWSKWCVLVFIFCYFSAWDCCWCDFLPPSQGPCTGNQQSLAHSRLWDAVVGFLHVFAHMMMKLAQVRQVDSFHYCEIGRRCTTVVGTLLLLKWQRVFNWFIFFLSLFHFQW